MQHQQRHQTIRDNWTKLIITLATMARAHEESAIKSTRVRSGKLAKLQAGIKHGKCPAWLKVTDDKQGFTLVEDQANTCSRPKVWPALRSEVLRLILAVK